MCMHGSILFNLICNMTASGKKMFYFRGRGCVKMCEYCLQVTAFVISINLICNMTVLKK